MKRRVVITGLGAINSMGHDVPETWANVKAGKCGIREITQIDTTNFTVKIGGEIENYNPEEYFDKKSIRHMDRYTQYARIAAKEAMKDSGLDMTKEDAYRCGTIICSGVGGLKSTEDEHARGEQRGFERMSPFFIPMAIANMAAGEIAIEFGLKGENKAVVTACASSSSGIGDAFHSIRDGYTDVMLAGGAEAAICNCGLGGFTVMKALYTKNDVNRASIPFDKERSGFVMGEGGAVIVLEELEHALARGAKIYGEMVGYGATCDAYHITAPNPTGESAARCMQMAVEDAGVALTDVGYINAHGTSTPLNDSGETAAIKRTFGDHAYKMMVSSTKSMTGHMLGASGAMEAIFSVLALHDGYIPATINYRVPDENCDLDIVPNEGRNVQVEYALSNSFGFGGHNASLLFKHYV